MHAQGMVTGEIGDRAGRRRATLRTAALGLAALLLGACAGSPPPGAPATGARTGATELLPSDPALVTGRLDNGLAYIVRRSPNPPGRVAMWLHVAAGSLNETEETRGLAHYLEHMAFNGSANFPPGALIPYFQSLGLSFGRDQNAFTGLDRTVYTLALPDTRAETVDRGFLYLADIAFRMSLLPREIAAERQIILEEKRAYAGARQRVRDQVLARLAPESTLGRRLPIGTEAAIRSVGPAEFRDFYARWYVASNMTVVTVGDVEPTDVVASIARHFGAARSVPRPPPPHTGVAATAGTRAIVVTDPELTQAEVELTRVEPARPPVTTVPAYRRQLAEYLGTWMFNRRLDAELAAGGVAFLKGRASVTEWAHAARIVTVQATAAPARWRETLADLSTALERARQHGFTPAEIAEARAALIAETEQAAQQEPTLPARSLLRRISESVARREPPLSTAQRLALQRRLLPGITADEASRVFAAGFDPAHLVFVLTVPSGVPAPSEAQLIGLGRAALDVRPAPALERAPATRLPAAPLPGGLVVEESRHEATGVWSGWLDNGVRVHHRQVVQRRHEAVIRISLAGGVIEERADNRGITEAAMRAWDRPAGGSLSSTDIRRLMTDKKVRVGGGFGPDAVTLTVSGDPASLEHGLELAHLLLTDPVLEAAGIEQWRERKLAEIAEQAVQPRGVLALAQAEAFYPAAEARLLPATAAQVRALTREAVQAWLRALIARAPMEIAVVGDIDRARAIALVARYLGALPPRPRIDATTLAAQRAVPRPGGPIQVARTVATPTDQAQVLAGFFGADATSVRDSRLLILASRVLSTRMTRTLREERQLVYSIGAYSQPGEAYPGFGVFAARAPTDPAKAGALVDAVEEMFNAFAAHGPTADELAVAKQQLATLLDEVTKGSDFWADRLATLDYRGLSLDDVARLATDYQRFTAEEVREALARYARPEARFRFVIVPSRAR